MISTIANHLVSLSSALWVTLNLLIGFILLLPIALLKLLLPIAWVRRGCDKLIDFIYRFAVAMDTFWMQRVVGIELVIEGEPNRAAAPVVICNHQSWFDIPLVQEIITGKGPMVKFLVKQELTWVPIIGWICLALNFPLLERNKNRQSRKSDFTMIQKASKEHGDDAGALLVFPEGTRFSEAKRKRQNSPYVKLLKPKAGGLKIIKKHINAGGQLVDITIDYLQDKVNIWDCLHGKPKKIIITLRHYSLDEIEVMEDWLNEVWAEKDQILLKSSPS